MSSSRHERLFFFLVIATVVAFYLGTIYGPPGGCSTTKNISRPNCSAAYGTDVNAYRACMAAFALQENWYPSPIAGLFSYPVWNGFDGFWQDGVVIETLTNLMIYGNNTMYKSVVQASIRDLYSLLVAYGPQPSYDDMGWYAMSYLRVHELLGPADDSTSYYGFLYESKQIYNWIWEYGWDNSETCSGGFWFDQTISGKQTVENARMLFLSAKLYRITGNKSLINDVRRTWAFIENNKLIDNETFMVSDGINLTSCQSVKVFGPSYNMGLMIGALIEAGPVLNKTDEFVDTAHKIAQAAIKNLSINGTLVEYCAPKCDDDAKLFKGIFMRNLRYFIDYLNKNPKAKDEPFKKLYMEYLRNNSETVWNHDRCEPDTEKCWVLYKDGASLSNVTVGPVFDKDYRGPFNSSCPITQTSVLDLFISSINANTTCDDKSACSFDPPPPTPKPLTCKNHPCPPDQPCCEYSDYYTCCEPTQKCIDGYCE